MIPLRIAGDKPGSTPNLQSAPDRDVQVWRELDGTAFAYCATVDGRHWIEMPGVARFCFQPTSSDVSAFPHPGTAPEVVGGVYSRTVLPMILQARGLEVLHASGVLTDAGVIAFCGASGTGKSTVAVGLGLRGHEVWADDAVAFEATGTSVLASPLPFRVRLRPAAAAFFARSANGAVVGADQVDADRAASRPERLRAVCVLQQVPHVDGNVSVERLAPVSALGAVLQHAFCFSLHDPQCKRRMTQRYVRLAEQVACVSIRFKPGLDGLSVILDAIEDEVISA